VKEDIGMQRRSISPWTWQDAWGFVQANEIAGFERLLICSGQVALDAEGQVIHVGGMRDQVRAVMDNLETVLDAADYSLADVVKLTIHTVDVERYRSCHDEVVRRTREAGCQPAISLLGVSALAFPEGMVEIQAIAAK
jgi:2-iminobutanoate/2-iminopropanoate deaminase